MNLKAKTAIFLIITALLWLPAVQQKTGLIREKDLRGQDDPPAFPKFTFKTWFSGEFQDKCTPAVEQHAGFRTWLIRMKNQLEYSLLKKANARGVVVGRKNYLYESDYIRSYTGRDYLGDYYWDQKFNRMKMVRDTLQKLGVNLAVVLEPGKATSHPEFIPSRFLKYRGEKNNYRAIVKRAGEKGIPLLDLNRYFADYKTRAPYPLFPKGGIHWSTGGMVVAGDTLLKFIGSRFGWNLPVLAVDRVEYPDTLRDTDGDVAVIMNLLFQPRHLKMGYPVFHFESDGLTKKPRVLTISDSFFFNILGAKIPANAFANEAFWYYNLKIYPDTWITPKDTSSIDIRWEIESMDVILIMVTERFYHIFDWDFTDLLYGYYYPKAEKEYRYDYMRDIIRFNEWFDKIQEQADYAGLSMESKLRGNAEYLFWEADQAGKIPHDADFYRMNITKDSAWMKQIREKAAINGISVDSQIHIDAGWLEKNNNQ